MPHRKIMQAEIAKLKFDLVQMTKQRNYLFYLLHDTDLPRELYTDIQAKILFERDYKK